MLDLKRVLASKPKPPADVELTPLWTPWGEKIRDGLVDDGLAGEGPRGAACQGHPRPQFARGEWTSLNGWWECAFVPAPDAARAWRGAMPPADAAWRPIRVPFSPEAPLSGVGRRLAPDELLWYRLDATLPVPTARERLVLHLDAVDWACVLYVNGARAGEHTGGYLPFSCDVTDLLIPGKNRLELCVFDPSDTGVQPRGKQRLARGGIWYTAQSGIWRDAWCEVVPRERLLDLDVRTVPEEGRALLRASVLASGERPMELVARLLDEGVEVARAGAMVVTAGESEVELALEVGEAHLWRPDDPHLYDLELAFGSDRVTSYVGFRSVEVRPDARGVQRVHLNGSPIFLRGVLDQGYWPDGLMTPPSERALASDICAARGLGFNLLRMHLKVESARFYALCDRMGMLVWQDMVSGGGPLSPWHSSYKPTLLRASWGGRTDEGPRAWRQLSAGDGAYRREWRDTCAGTVRALRSHPCVVGWTLFNEGWGQFDARAATRAVRELDPTRPIDATSGWYDRCCGDFLSVHNYFRPLEVWPDRARPARAFVISEFGGVSWAVPGHVSLSTSYGYEAAAGRDEFSREVRDLLARADELEAEGLAGFVYTQLTDVEEETNGLVTYDRRVNKLTASG